MNRRRWLGATAATAAQLALGCERHEAKAPSSEPARSSNAAPQTATTPSTTTKPRPKATWPIGVYLPMSGADSSFGVDTLRGIELAVAAVNAAGGAQGRELELLIEDDRSLASEVAAGVKRLIERGRVVALLGEVSSSRSVLGAAIAQAGGVPMITPASTHRDVTQDRPFVFRACFIDELQGHAAAELAVAVLKKKKLGLIHAKDDLYSSGLALEFQKAARVLGGKLVASVEITASETSFDAALKALQKQRPEIVFAPLYFHQMSKLAEQAKTKKWSGEMFIGGDGWASDPRLLQLLEGAHYTDHWALDLPLPASRQFVSSYRAAHQIDPTGMSALGHDAVLLLADAIRRAPSVDGPGIRAALAITKDVAGVTGNISFDPDRNATKAVVVAKITGGAARFAALLGPGGAGADPSGR